MWSEYSLIAMAVLSLNLLANLLFIDHAIRKQRRSQKKTSPVIAILDSNIKNVIKPPKKAYLFLKPPKLPPSIDKVAINITKVSSKIVKLDIYKKAIRKSIYAAYWKKVICIEFEILYLNNT